jgi:hypothetical protein
LPTYTDKENIQNVVRITTNQVCLSEILATMESYLKASGFVFDGHLDIVEDTDA